MPHKTCQVLAIATTLLATPALAQTRYTLTDLGTLHNGGEIADYSTAFRINTAGDVVGEMNGLGFLYHDGAFTDLNTVVDHNEDGWPRIVSATGINDAGQIVGRAYFGDRPGTRAFLLTPVPEP